MPKMRNGIGTAYFGASDRRDDGSFITTKWFVLLDVPLIPLGSERVKHLGESAKVFKTANYYQSIEKVKLDSRLVLTVYVWVLGLLALVVVALIISVSASVVYLGIGMFMAVIVFWIFVFPVLYKPK